MNEPWTLLDIAPTDDVRAIKRAYAARLKQYRPDEDADGFMALRQAYEWALNRASILGVAESAPPFVPPAEPLEQPFSAEAAAVETTTRPLPFNAWAETEAILAIAGDPAADGATVAAALSANPAFWALDHKPMVSTMLAEHICQEPAHGPKLAVVLALGTFFHWNDIAEQRRLAANGVDIYDLQARLQAAELDARLQNIGRGAPKELRLASRIRRCGTGPLAWLWAAILWRHIPRINDLLGNYPPPVVELAFGPGTLRFWHRANGTIPNLLELSLKLARTCLFMLGYFLVGEVALLFSSGTRAADSFEFFGMITLLACEVTTTLYALRVLCAWSQEPLRERFWILPQWVDSPPAAYFAIAATTAFSVLLPLDFMRALSAVAVLFGIWALTSRFHIPPFIKVLAALIIIGKAIRYFDLNVHGLIDTGHIWLILPFCLLIIATANLTARPLASRLPALYHRYVPPQVSVWLFILAAWLGGNAVFNGGL